MTDPTNPNINPAPSNDETPAAYTGGTTADANQQDIEVTETFTTAMPQMPDLPPNPNGTMDDPYSADQQATTAMPNVAAHTANPYTQPATANTPQYGQPASNPYTQPAADQYAQPAADPYTQPSADPYGQQYAQPQYGQPAPGTPTYAAVPTGYIPRNKILAGLLALFFGALGIHNFYLGFTKKAIMQIVLSGCVDYTVPSINGLGTPVDNILKAVETGSELYFDWIYSSDEDVAEFEGVESTLMFSQNYENWVEFAAEQYLNIKEKLSGVATGAITQHRELAIGVYRTDWENGGVIVNYTNKDITVDGISIAAKNFVVTEKR